MQVTWMVTISLRLALSGVLALAVGTHMAACASRRCAHRPPSTALNRTAIGGARGLWRAAPAS